MAKVLGAFQGRMEQSDSGHVVYRADPARETSIFPVPGVEAVWGCSDHSPTPTWHFRSLPMQCPRDVRLPSTPVNELLRTLSTMGVLAGLPDTFIPMEGSGETLCSCEIALGVGHSSYLPAASGRMVVYAFYCLVFRYALSS